MEFYLKKLFTERYGATKPRVSESLDTTTRVALLNLLSARIGEEWFGLSFPQGCADGYVYAVTDLKKLHATLTGYGLLIPSDARENDAPTDGEVFDLVEFAYEYIAEPKNPSFHRYMGHSHYDYDQASGREKFAHDVNRIFERNGMAFELRQGEVARLAPGVLHAALAATTFRTSDPILDSLLETAREKFLHRMLKTRQESLEKLWDAWERLKTLEDGKDKKARAKALLDKAAPDPAFRLMLEQEASALTEIGNKFMIRHTETDKTPIAESGQVDYLFHRLFALMHFLLKASGRAQ